MIFRSTRLRRLEPELLGQMFQGGANLTTINHVQQWTVESHGKSRVR